MQLSDEQKGIVKSWVEEGYTLAELQHKINDELKLVLTFMDVRLLILDLGLQIKDRAAASGTVDLSKTSAKTSDMAETADAPTGTGGVAVTLDRIVKPGAMASGQVTFSDGVRAEWTLDQMGQLGLSSVKPDYRPSQKDLQSFQKELAQQLQSRGM